MLNEALLTKYRPVCGAVLALCKHLSTLAKPFVKLLQKCSRILFRLTII